MNRLFVCAWLFVASLASVTTAPTSAPTAAPTATAAPANGTLSTASGEGLLSAVAGVPAEFRILTFDSSGLPVDVGGANISIHNEGSSNVTDNGDGSYTVSINDTIAANGHLLGVVLNGDHIVGSPFSRNVTAGAVSPQATSIAGEGLRAGHTNETKFFFIQLRDAFENPTADSSAVVAVNVSGGPDNITAQVVEAAAGSYNITWRPTENAYYQVEVFVNGEHVSGSPFTAAIGVLSTGSDPLLPPEHIAIIVSMLVLALCMFVLCCFCCRHEARNRRSQLPGLAQTETNRKDYATVDSSTDNITNDTTAF